MHTPERSRVVFWPELSDPVSIPSGVLRRPALHGRALAAKFGRAMLPGARGGAEQAALGRASSPETSRLEYETVSCALRQDLHDGSAATLRDAVDAMFEFQLGREAPAEDKEAIVAFIRTLAGESEELSP